MSSIQRRTFIAGLGATAGLAGSAFAAMGPNDKFDLLIKGGEVLDPSQGLRGKRDIGMRATAWSKPSRTTSPLPVPAACSTPAAGWCCRG